MILIKRNSKFCGCLLVALFAFLSTKVVQAQIYEANSTYSSASIGEYDTNGNALSVPFVTGGDPNGLAISGNSLY
jgi:hypothetical protein